MNLDIKFNPFPHILIYDFFTEKELKDIWKELKFLTSPENLLPPDRTGGARRQDGTFKKQNKALFLDQVYTGKPNISYILKYGSKLYNDKDVQEKISNSNWIFKWLIHIGNKYNTLLSYYEDTDYYEPHADTAFFTTLIHLFEEPINFKGGDLYFPDYDYTLENRNNRMIIFPSIMTHEVKPISMNIDEEYSGKGRYTITQFIHTV